MKYVNIQTLLVAVSMSLFSCADDGLTDYKTEKPQSIAQYEYLNAYDALKTYVDRAANPDFKLGAGITVSDFLKKELVYSMACRNFDELTAGNAMKYASCVKDNGSMDFSQVKKFVETAKVAGLTIYGHTLAWHSQQNNTYLNGIIADKKVENNGGTLKKWILNLDFSDGQAMGGWGNGSTREVVSEGPEGSKCMKMTNPSVTNFWSAQAATDVAPEADKKYYLSFKLRGTTAGILRAGFQNTSNYSSCGDFPNVAVTTEWTDVLVETTAAKGANRFLFSYGDYGGSIYIDNLELYAEEEAGGTVVTNEYIYQSDFSDGVAIGGWGNNSTREVVNEASSTDGKVLKIYNPSATNFWAAQMALDVADAFTVGETYYVTIRTKASGNGTLRMGFQKTSNYSSVGEFPNIALTTEWKEYTLSCKCTGEGGTRLIFSFGDFAGSIFIDDLALYTQKEKNSIPLTPEEKKDTLTWAMDNWVTGMMKACDGYVTAWDVVNEALSGTDKNGDGYYDLQSATRGTVSESDAKANFYWQDYLGDEDYVRTAVRLARQRFAEHGGTPANLRLFINDYNLESDWDDNKKLKSLIHWISRWEADGVTKIDGIGTQMHVSCYMNPETQASKKNAVVKMFQLMAETGKLVKITELDMGMVNESGKSVSTEEITEEQHRAMADFYEFILQKYFEIIPAAQRYGITQWATTDSPANSGWRGGEPIGLWDLNYNRKHTYAGFVNGLSGGK